MFSLKERLKLLTRIAQTAATSTTGLPQTTPTPAASVPPPPGVQASALWPALATAYNSQTVQQINGLVALLNTALHYSSNGQYNFQILKNDNFQVDQSGFPSMDTKNIFLVCSIVYKTFINAGHDFAAKPTGIQIKGWGDSLIASQPYLNLSQLNPTGPLAQKVRGNPKDQILAIIRAIELANPIQQR